MKRRLALYFALWGVMLGLMLVFKVLFMVIEPAYPWSDLSQLPAVLWHGLSMDITMSAYLVAPVLLWTVATLWVSDRQLVQPRSATNTVLNVWLWIVAVFMGCAYVCDAVLYPFWNFRLDSTPLFYFTTAPGAALASVAWYWELLALLVAAGMSWGIRLLLGVVTARIMPLDLIARRKRQVWCTVAWLALGGAMIIPIRGGVTVSTMTPGRAYFSDEMRLNHAAVNPMFSFVHSLAHIDNLGDQFNFFSDDKAQAIADAYFGAAPAATDSVPAITLTDKRPDIYVIILESFSAHLMPSLGGEAVAVNLDSIARQGVLFTNFYAESFRTDRALPTILSGYPAMPTTSGLRYTNKFGNMPSLARTLRRAGYSTSYFYGGDIEFTNMKGYLVATGFQNLVKDSDFPVSQRLSKWGAHDQHVFERAAADQAPSPALRVIQTSSSHEPYDVPYTSSFSDERANAFAYADKCLGDFVNALKTGGKWDNALVVIVPDHWGSYPRDLKDRLASHHVPLVLTGGALSGAPARIDAVGSQSAIAPTVLALMGLDTSDFYRPVNLLDSGTVHHAWITRPEWMGFIDNREGFTAVFADGDKVAESRPGTLDAEAPQSAAPDPDLVRAFTQLLYNDFDKR